MSRFVGGAYDHVHRWLCYPDSVFEVVGVGMSERCARAGLADASDTEPLNDDIEAHVHDGGSCRGPTSSNPPITGSAFD